MNTRSNQIKHFVVALNSSFETFTRNLESALGKLEPQKLSGHFDTSASLIEAIKKMEGYQGLMLFNKYDHGALLTIIDSPKKAIHYMIGNPLIASTMTRYDLRAGLYAPLQAVVYEGAGKMTYIEYDLPSDLFGQFCNDNVTSTGRSLDEKFEKLIKKPTPGISALFSVYFECGLFDEISHFAGMRQHRHVTGGKNQRFGLHALCCVPLKIDDEHVVLFAYDRPTGFVPPCSRSDDFVVRSRGEGPLGAVHHFDFIGRQVIRKESVS